MKFFQMHKVLSRKVESSASNSCLSNSIIVKEPNILAIYPRNFTTTRLPHFTVTLLEVSSYDKTASVKLASSALYNASTIFHPVLSRNIQAEYCIPLF